MAIINTDHLKTILNYDSETGVFKWKVKKSKNTKIGDIAGSLDLVHGYILIRINGRSYRAHRLAWLYVYGEMPNIIDHINGDKLNNSINNLRVANVFQNGWNSKLQSNNKSGYKGVSYCKLNKKFRAQIKILGVNKTLGYFNSAIDAAIKYRDVAKELHGKFYRETTPLQGS